MSKICKFYDKGLLWIGVVALLSSTAAANADSPNLTISSATNVVRHIDLDDPEPIDEPVEREEKTSIQADQLIVDWRRSDEKKGPKNKIERMLHNAAFQNRIGNPAGAVEIYDKVLSMEPDNFSALFSKGTTLIQIKRYRDALDALLPMAEEYPQNYMIQNNIAWIYATAEDVGVRDGEKALSHARNALLLSPNDYHVWNTLSESYFISAEYEKAVERARTALQMAFTLQESDRQMQKLKQQLLKCNRAAVTMSIME